jgi:hypothetical protein
MPTKVDLTCTLKGTTTSNLKYAAKFMAAVWHYRLRPLPAPGRYLEA